MTTVLLRSYQMQYYGNRIVNSLNVLTKRFYSAKGVSIEKFRNVSFRNPRYQYYVAVNRFQTSGAVSCDKKPLSDQDLKIYIEKLSDSFLEAMTSLADAKTSVGTVYFSEDFKDAKTTVCETLEDFNNLCNKLNEGQYEKVNNSIGLKMKELQAQLGLLDELADGQS
ncbi:Uncharacterised protein g8133 [Pycnogonum litorale]